MKSLLVLIFFFFTQIGFGQPFHVMLKNLKDSSEHFYVVRPPGGIIKGLLVLNDKALSDSAKKKAYSLHNDTYYSIHFKHLTQPDK